MIEGVTPVQVAAGTGRPRSETDVSYLYHLQRSFFGLELRVRPGPAGGASNSVGTIASAHTRSIERNEMRPR